MEVIECKQVGCRDTCICECWKPRDFPGLGKFPEQGKRVTSQPHAAGHSASVSDVRVPFNDIIFTEMSSICWNVMAASIRPQIFSRANLPIQTTGLRFVQDADMHVFR